MYYVTLWLWNKLYFTLLYFILLIMPILLKTAGVLKLKSPWLEIGLIMIIILLRFSQKMTPNNNRFSRKNDSIIAIIVISRKTKNRDNHDNRKAIIDKRISL
jgi:hypothetical protein